LQSKGQFIIRVASGVAILWSVFQLYTAGMGFFHVMVQRPIHLGFALFVTFLTYPLITRKTANGRPAPGRIDLILALVAVAAIIYMLVDQERIIKRVIFVDSVATTDIVAGFILIILSLEAGRRTLGLTLPIVALCFLAYLFLGPYFPIDALAHSGISLARFIDLQILAPQGLFGIPIGVSTDTVFYFLLFGAFLEESGGGRLFTDVALKLTGRMRGGSAKTSVVASGLMGTISGSAVANVVVDGMFTISMMKRTGFKGDFAAAVMVPALIELGLVPIAAHMFVFYFACLSMVTPPVALAAYAAAGIAKSDTWTTGWIAFMLALGGFVVPFAFAQNPALLMQITSIPEFIWLLTTLTIGIFALSAAVIYLGPPRYGWLLRPAFVIAGFLLVDPGIITDIIGFALLAAVLLFNHLVTKRGKAPVAEIQS